MKRPKPGFGMISSAVLLSALGFISSTLADEPTPGSVFKQVMESDQPREEIGTRDIKGSGGGGMGYTCGATECTCTGDIDCNNMFTSGKCKGTIWDAGCDNSGPAPKCWCSTAARSTQFPKGGLKAPLGQGQILRRGVEGEQPDSDMANPASPSPEIGERGLSRAPMPGRMVPGGSVVTPGGSFSALTKAECTGLGCQAVTDNTCPDVGALRERCVCKGGTKGVCIDAVK